MYALQVLAALLVAMFGLPLLWNLVIWLLGLGRD
jgi:hypothetical protein